MKLSRRLQKIIPVGFAVLISLITIFLVYYGSIPERYSLTPGMVSDVNISATRSVKDTNETKKLAEESMNAVVPISVKSDEISQKDVADLTKFFSACTDLRNNNMTANGTYIETYPALSARLIKSVENSFGFTLTEKESYKIVTCEQTVLDYIQTQTVSIASLILTDKVDETVLAQRIDELTADVVSSDSLPHVSSAALVKTLLANIVKPNSVYDEAATEEARQAAYNAVISDPVMIEKGSRIVSSGEVITNDSYQMLKDLDLIVTDHFDFQLLGGVFIYCIILLFVLGIYVKQFEPEFLKNTRDVAALSLSFLLPVVCGVYLSDFSTLVSPVFFFAVIAATYLGTQSGIVLAILQMLIMLPMYQYDIVYVFVSIAGIFVSSMIAGHRSRKYNSASLILLTALSCVLAAVAINQAMKSSRTDLLVSALWAVISGSVAVIASIGFMPIFELISNTVSPIRLIDLSQPGNPLLKRLFVEAPGTSQHSMMVANLADSAAEAIGANALLAKVGAYYHDIGKLEKPQFFTENQQNGKNPHDTLSPEESTAIITAHPDQGVRLARRFRLPASIVNIIQEHHGSTFQAYFYHKAKTLAAENGLPEPAMSAYRYRCSIPTSRESAVVMLADTCEAAIRSTGITNLDGAEELFRKLIKQKIDQDQLVSSGLSFNDIELIIRSFLQVYAGFFHERIKYPDDSVIRK